MYHGFVRSAKRRRFSGTTALKSECDHHSGQKPAHVPPKSNRTHVDSLSENAEYRLLGDPRPYSRVRPCGDGLYLSPTEKNAQVEFCFRKECEIDTYNS
jgi:hypothetical protein